MSRRGLVLGGLIVAGLVAAVSLALPASAANLLGNAGFESGSLTGWSCSGGLGSVVTSPVHGGSYALAGAVNDSDNATCTQTVSVQPSTTYTLSAWVRGSYVYLGVTGGTSTWTPSATSYSQLTTSFTTGGSQTSAQIYLHGWYAQGTYYADDVSLARPSPPPPRPRRRRPRPRPPRRRRARPGRRRRRCRSTPSPATGTTSSTAPWRCAYATSPPSTT